MSTYSWGAAAQPLAWPTNDPELAHFQARRASTEGAAWTVHEYPPGDPQPGTLVATYLNGELVQGSGPGA